MFTEIADLQLEKSKCGGRSSCFTANFTHTHATSAPLSSKLRCGNWRNNYSVMRLVLPHPTIILQCTTHSFSMCSLVSLCF